MSEENKKPAEEKTLEKLLQDIGAEDIQKDGGKVKKVTLSGITAEAVGKQLNLVKKQAEKNGISTAHGMIQFRPGGVDVNDKYWVVLKFS